MIVMSGVVMMLAGLLRFLNVLPTSFNSCAADDEHDGGVDRTVTVA